MKLRNKKTGKIYNVQFCNEFEDVNCGVYVDSLAELNEEWEDYEDELYYIISAEHKGGYICALKEDYKELCETAKELGIGFETEKEAMEAVEKLKAWKRLKDNGFKFEGIEKRGYYINFYQGRSYETDKQCQQAMKDLDLLFGGEE